MNKTPVLEVRGLTRTYGERPAIQDLSLTVYEGDVYGFLGPNGSGKTTSMRCILGLIRKDAGDIRLFGQPASPKMRREVGAIIETPAFYGWMSGRQNLKVAAAALGMRDNKAEIDRVLTRVGLLERADERAAGYSLGMKQRLGIARALLGKPKFLMLDEPSNGLDPRGMREMRELIRSLAVHDQITVFISSHILSEVQAVCDRVGILGNGVLKMEGRVAELLGTDVSNQHIIDVGGVEKVALDSFLGASGRVVGAGQSGRLRIATADDPAALLKRLVEAGEPVSAFVPVERDLEDVFMEVTE